MANAPTSHYTPTVDELKEELQMTAQALRTAYDKFNFVTEPELVEAAIFEIRSLNARYTYLIRRVKELDGSAVSVAAGAMKGGRLCQS
ncbi:MAG: DUF2508 family protein [Eubacteriales bacterium]|nr:DUF2508 family protein [Eubacteriales bacterium]